MRRRRRAGDVLAKKNFKEFGQCENCLSNLNRNFFKVARPGPLTLTKDPSRTCTPSFQPHIKIHLEKNEKRQATVV